MNTPKTLTGSRAFGVASRLSDTDWVSTHAPPAFAYGWKMIPYGLGDGYCVYRRQAENWIVCTSKTSYQRWMKAHWHCVRERPRSKERRKVIFDHYMYGTPLDRQSPLPRDIRQWFIRQGARRSR